MLGRHIHTDRNGCTAVYIHVSIPDRDMDDTSVMTYTQASGRCVCEVEFVTRGVQVRSGKILSTVGGLPDVRHFGKSAMDMGCLFCTTTLEDGLSQATGWWHDDFS